MGFLDNSGDIILDVVLTDHGRMLLAKGDGSFQITKFALSDEEIERVLYLSFIPERFYYCMQQIFPNKRFSFRPSVGSSAAAS